MSKKVTYTIIAVAAIAVTAFVLNKTGVIGDKHKGEKEIEKNKEGGQIQVL